MESWQEKSTWINPHLFHLISGTQMTLFPAKDPKVFLYSYSGYCSTWNHEYLFPTIINRNDQDIGRCSQIMSRVVYSFLKQAVPYASLTGDISHTLHNAWTAKHSGLTLVDWNTCKLWKLEILICNRFTPSRKILTMYAIKTSAGKTLWQSHLSHWSGSCCQPPCLPQGILLVYLRASSAYEKHWKTHLSTPNHREPINVSTQPLSSGLRV